MTLNSCTGIATVALAGGQGAGSYFGAGGSDVIFASASGNFGFIRRQSGTNATGLTTVNVSFSDGRSAVPVTVNLTGAAAGPC